MNSRFLLLLLFFLPSLGWSAGPKTTERFTLSGGSVLLALKRPQAQVLSAVAVARAGAAAEPAGKQGLAALAASLIPAGGTGALSPREIEQALQTLGATVTSGTETDTNWIALSCPPQNLRPAIRLFADLVMNPSFEVAATEKAKRTLQARDREVLADAKAVVEKELKNRLLEDRENRDAGRIDSWTPALSSITRNDLIRFHRASFDPSRTIFAVSGDFSAGDIKAEVENALAGWTARKGPDRSPTAAPIRPGTASVLIPETERGRFSFVLGRLGFKPGDPHVAAEGVLFTLAGSRPFAAAIARRSRVNGDALKGSLVLSRDAEGRFFYRLTFEGDEKHRDTIVKYIRTELERMKKKKPPADQLRLAKIAFRASALPEETDTTQALIDAASLEAYGILADYRATMEKEIEKVSAEEITSAAAHCLESF